MNKWEALRFRKLKGFKALHVKWIVKTYEYLKKQDEDVMNGFNTAGITKVVNPFDQKRVEEKIV